MLFETLDLVAGEWAIGIRVRKDLGSLTEVMAESLGPGHEQSWDGIPPTSWGLGQPTEHSLSIGTVGQAYSVFFTWTASQPAPLLSKAVE